MHGGRAAEWTDLASPAETRELTVRLARKENARHVAHITVPYDRGANRKLYVKVALTASWLRRVFADRPFSVRRARDVANATEIMSDKGTVMSAVSILEEMCRFHAHDAASVRRYPSSCVSELVARAPPDFDFLFANDGDGDDDGALFAVRVGRVTGTKVHVYAAPENVNQDAREPQRVVVFGTESDVLNTLSALAAMIDRVNDGESHASARAWALRYLSEVYSDAAARGEGDDTGGGWEDDSPDAKPIVIRRCEQEVTSWLEEKERRAAATAVDDRSGAGAASYAAIVSSTPTRPSHAAAPDAPSSEDHSEGDSPNDDSKAENGDGGCVGVASTGELPAPPPPVSSSGPMNPVMSSPVNHRAPAFASAPWTPPPPMASPWANPAAAAAAAMMCRGCGCYPRRVAFLPCSHLALCLLCNDVTKKSNAPCVVCGAHVKERLIFYLD